MALKNDFLKYKNEKKNNKISKQVDEVNLLYTEKKEYY